MFNANNLRGLFKTSLVLSAVVSSLTGCGSDSITSPISDKTRPDVRFEAGAARARIEAITAVNSASAFQLIEVVGCLDAGATINATPKFDENTTLAEFSAMTSEIVAWRQSIVDYIAALPLGQVTKITSCLSAALGAGSSDSDAQKVVTAISNLSITDILAARPCFEDVSGMPISPDFDPATATLSEIVAKTPELVAYKEAVLARLATLSLSELSEMTPCLAASGIIA